MNQSISFLLGAGFSAPMKYPTGPCLNKKLINCSDDNIIFNDLGQLHISENGEKSSAYYGQFEFCCDLMSYFKDVKGYFDYEEFYDFLIDDAVNDEGVKKLFEKIINKSESDLNQMIFAMKNVYNQLVLHFLVDGEGKSWYDNNVFTFGPTFSGYTGILKCFQEFRKNYISNIHSLNHDLFFESLNKSDWFQNEICDGFHELGSPYYGILYSKGHKYKVRLECYTGIYEKNCRYYKLHGSRDYGVYYSSDGPFVSQKDYIKIKYGINIANLYKEIYTKENNLEYEYCGINYHADFLTGTTSKIERYQEPLLFKKLFLKFRNNLKEAQKLIIIGYGGRDKKINEMILDNFDFKNKPVFIIDPYPKNDIQNLKDKVNGKLIKKFLSDIEITDLL